MGFPILVTSTHALSMSLLVLICRITPKKQQNREGCDYTRRERIKLINPVVRWIGGCIRLSLAFLFARPTVDGWLLYDRWHAIASFLPLAGLVGASIVGLFVFISGLWCLTCTQSDGQEQNNDQLCHDGNTVPDSGAPCPYCEGYATLQFGGAT